MMYAGPCPRCQQLVRFPQRDPSTPVRCPLCSQQFPLQEFLDQLPPEVEIVSAENAPLGQNADAASRPSFDFRQNLPAPAGDVAPVQARTRRRSGSRRRSLGDELAKIVFGGVVGMALAQLLLWWLPQPWRRDPLGLAPRLPRSLSLLAPADLREEPDQRSDRPLGNSDEPATDGEKRPHPNPPEERSWEAPDGPVPRPKNGKDAGSDTPAPSGGRALTAYGVAGIAPFDGPQLRRAVQEASRMTQTLQAGEGTSADRRRWAQSVSDLAFAVTFADEQDQRVTEQAESVAALVVQIGQTPRLRATLTTWQQRLWRGAVNQLTGVLVFGQAVEIQPLGPLYETQVEQPDGSTVRVISRVNPSDPARTLYRPGNQIGLLGTLVPDATERLIGYVGDQEQVIWGGLPVRLPSPATTAIPAPARPPSG